MKAPFVAAALLLAAACTSGIELDLQGAYRCVPTSTTERTVGGCPPGLFCGADQTCHTADAGGDYPCAGDFGCGGEFRCGPLGRCVDPRDDALRADAPDVTLSFAREIGPGAPWDAVTGLGIGRTFQGRSADGQLTDVTPMTIADGKRLFTAAVSNQGFSAAERLFLGEASFPLPVVDAAPVRQLVYALTADRFYRYAWTAEFDGGIPTLVVGASDPRIGDRFRVGNSAFPIVAELNPTTRQYRLHDSAKTTNNNTGQVPLVAPISSGVINDLVDTDGRYLYASFNGVLNVALRADALFAIANNGNNVNWSVVGLVSPGRDEQLVNCAGGSVGEVLSVRAIHVGDNPDLTQIERPLIALEVDVTRPDGGVQPTHWMRVDPDPISAPCGAVPRHIARGFCPACGPNEQLKDLQWARGPGLQPVLRADCAGADGGLAFYDLQTDATGFACLRERRLGGGPPGNVSLRQRSNATVQAVAVDSRIYLRRDGLQPYVPLTLDHAPIAIEQLPTGRVALGSQAIFRELPSLGFALSSFAERSDPFPVAIASGSPWLIYDNGRVADLAQLGRVSPESLAAPSRTDLKPPFAGARASASDGRSFLLMSSFDALLVADMSDAGTVAPLEVRVVPEAQVPILSVVALPPSDAGALVSGYVLTENRLFSLSAASEAQWDVRPVDVPEGEWTKLFVDQRRTRLGYENGTVVALPSGVRLASPLPSPAKDYIQYCGRSFALTSSALYRLDSAGSPVGTWLEVKLPGLTGTRWTRLHESRTGELWVLSDDGRAVALRGAPCG